MHNNNTCLFDSEVAQKLGHASESTKFETISQTAFFLLGQILWLYRDEANLVDLNQFQFDECFILNVHVEKEGKFEKAPNVSTHFVNIMEKSCSDFEDLVDFRVFQEKEFEENATFVDAIYVKNLEKTEINCRKTTNLFKKKNVITNKNDLAPKVEKFWLKPFQECDISKLGLLFAKSFKILNFYSKNKISNTNDDKIAYFFSGIVKNYCPEYQQSLEIRKDIDGCILIEFLPWQLNTCGRKPKIFPIVFKLTQNNPENLTSNDFIDMYQTSQCLNVPKILLFKAGFNQPEQKVTVSRQFRKINQGFLNFLAENAKKLSNQSLTETKRIVRAVGRKYFETPDNNTSTTLPYITGEFVSYLPTIWNDRKRMLPRGKFQIFGEDLIGFLLEKKNDVDKIQIIIFHTGKYPFLHEHFLQFLSVNSRKRSETPENQHFTISIVLFRNKISFVSNLNFHESIIELFDDSIDIPTFYSKLQFFSDSANLNQLRIDLYGCFLETVDFHLKSSANLLNSIKGMLISTKNVSLLKSLGESYDPLLVFYHWTSKTLIYMSCFGNDKSTTLFSDHAFVKLIKLEPEIANILTFETQKILEYSICLNDGMIDLRKSSKLKEDESITEKYSLFTTNNIENSDLSVRTKSLVNFVEDVNPKDGGRFSIEYSMIDGLLGETISIFTVKIDSFLTNTLKLVCQPNSGAQLFFDRFYVGKHILSSSIKFLAQKLPFFLAPSFENCRKSFFSYKYQTLELPKLLQDMFFEEMMKINQEFSTTKPDLIKRREKFMYLKLDMNEATNISLPSTSWSNIELMNNVIWQYMHYLTFRDCTRKFETEIVEENERHDVIVCTHSTGIKLMEPIGNDVSKLINLKSENNYNNVFANGQKLFLYPGEENDTFILDALGSTEVTCPNVSKLITFVETPMNFSCNIPKQNHVVLYGNQLEIASFLSVAENSSSLLNLEKFAPDVRTLKITSKDKNTIIIENNKNGERMVTAENFNGISSRQINGDILKIDCGVEFLKLGYLSANHFHNVYLQPSNKFCNYNLEIQVINLVYIHNDALRGEFHLKMSPATKLLIKYRSRDQDKTTTTVYVNRFIANLQKIEYQNNKHELVYESDFDEIKQIRIPNKNIILKFEDGIVRKRAWDQFFHILYLGYYETLLEILNKFDELSVIVEAKSPDIHMSKLIIISRSKIADVIFIDLTPRYPVWVSANNTEVVYSLEKQYCSFDTKLFHHFYISFQEDKWTNVLRSYLLLGYCMQNIDRSAGSKLILRVSRNKFDIVLTLGKLITETNYTSFLNITLEDALKSDQFKKIKVINKASIEIRMSKAGILQLVPEPIFFTNDSKIVILTDHNLEMNTNVNFNRNLAGCFRKIVVEHSIILTNLLCELQTDFTTILLHKYKKSTSLKTTRLFFADGIVEI